MEWIKGLRDGLWVIVGLLVGLALLSEVGLPVGHNFFVWITTGNNALGFIGLVLAGGVAVAAARNA